MKSFYKVKNYHFSFFKCEQREIPSVVVIIMQTNYHFKTSLSFTFGATLQWGNTTYIHPGSSNWLSWSSEKQSIKLANWYWSINDHWYSVTKKWFIDCYWLDFHKILDFLYDLRTLEEYGHFFTPLHLYKNMKWDQTWSFNNTSVFTVFNRSHFTS